MREFNIFGAIVDSNIEKESVDDVTPSEVNSFMSSVADGDVVVFNINSPGGSVTAGISIANQIKIAQQRGVKATAKVNGICASIASVVMCACDSIVINDSAFVMIHNCWGVVQGDSNTLRKEAETMDKMNKAILSFYRSKFDLSDEELARYMDEETWFSGSEAQNFRLKCEVVHSDEQFKIAASLKKLNFKHLPKGLDMEEEKEVLEEENKANIEEALEETEQTEQPEQTEDTCEKDEEPSVEELKQKIEELEAKLAQYEEDEDTVPKEECEKRVSGMQAKMQLKINDFANQLRVRDEELANVKAEAISFKNELEQSKKELSDMTSAFEDKAKALAELNASVNTPSETTNWRNLRGKEFFDYLKKNNIH